MPSLEPYDKNLIILYVALIAMLEIIIMAWILSLPYPGYLLSVLPFLAQIDGIAFAFIFSLGMYTLKTSERLASEWMPMFSPLMIIYAMLFVASIIVPLLPFGQFPLILGYDVFLLFPYMLSVLSLSLIPLSFDMFRYRLRAQSIIRYVAKKARKQLKSLDAWDRPWYMALDIERIAMELHESMVDTFSGALGEMLGIMSEGAELLATHKKQQGKRDLSQERWLQNFYLRLYWVGQRVVNDFLAFERVCVWAVEQEDFRKHDFGRALIWQLCGYANGKNEESLKKALYHGIRACGAPQPQELLRSIPYAVLNEVVNEELKFSDSGRAEEFDKILNSHPDKPQIS